MKRLLTLVGVLAIAGVGLAWWFQPTDGLSEDADDISVFGPLLGREAEAFAEVLADFEAITGIGVRYTGSANFEVDLRNRVRGGVSSPDVALIPQPGLISELILEGAVVPLPTDVAERVEVDIPIGLAEIGVEGVTYVVPYRTNVKSIVWYRPSMFDEAGWRLPTTLDELGDLTDRIQATGVAPFCFSIFAGGATGWPATDWVEDLLLRRAGPDAYDRWVAGELGYDSPEVRGAIAEFTDLVLDPGRAAGGQSAILETPVRDASSPLFEDPPNCALYKQASFAEEWFPASVDIGPDGDLDFFVVPGVEPDSPAPLLRGIDSLVQFNDRPEVGRLMSFLASPAGVDPWIQRGGFLTDRSDVDLGAYDDVDRRFADLLREGRVERFDASDALLSNTRAFLLDEFTAYIAGTRSIDTFVDDIDAFRSDEFERLSTSLGLAPPD